MPTIEVPLRKKGADKSEIHEPDSAGVGREKSGEYSCKICYECYRYPVSLNCGHTFCYYCIRKMARRTAIPCGICRKLTKTDYRELGKNITMMDIGQLDDDSQSPKFEEPTDEVEPPEEIEWVPEPVIFEGIMEEAPTAEGMMRAIQSADQEVEQIRPGYNQLGLGPNNLTVAERRQYAIERFNRRAARRTIVYQPSPPSGRLWSFSSGGWGSLDGADEPQEEEQQNEAEVEQQQQPDEPEAQPPTVHENHLPPPPQAQEEKAASSTARAKKVKTRVRVPEQTQVVPVDNRDYGENIPTAQRIPMSEENQSTDGRNVLTRRVRVINDTDDREYVPPRRTRVNRGRKNQTDQLQDVPQVRTREFAIVARENVPPRRARANRAGNYGTSKIRRTMCGILRTPELRGGGGSPATSTSHPVPTVPVRQAHRKTVADEVWALNHFIGY